MSEVGVDDTFLVESFDEKGVRIDFRVAIGSAHVKGSSNYLQRDPRCVRVTQLPFAKPSQTPVEVWRKEF